MQITVSVGDKDLEFNVDVTDYNQYINEQMPQDKVQPAYNFLVRTVAEESKDDFKQLAISDGKPNGLIVLQIVGLITQEIGGSVSITIKKPKDSPAKSKPTVTKYANG